MLASTSRVFMDAGMHWTLQVICSDCGCETMAPLLMGIPARCDGCGAVIKIDLSRTSFHREATVAL